MATGQSNETKSTNETKKRRAPQGPRKPQPIYVFGTVSDASGNRIDGAKFVVDKVTKNARDIAKWASEGGLASGVQLITVEMPTEGEKGTATDGASDPAVSTGE